MNIRRSINRRKRSVRRWWHTNKRRHDIKIYAGFIIIVSVICLLLASLFGGNRIKKWYVQLTKKEVINKGIQYSNNVESVQLYE